MIVGGESGVIALKHYLDYAGILTCNENPYLPCLSDIGCGWEDVSALIDSHGLFYSKVYRGRTTYLSPKAYYLLKRCRTPKPMDESAACVYALLQDEPMEMETLKLLSCMDPKQLAKSFDFLLRNLYVTALRNGKILNPQWSTYYYGTAEAWEAHVKEPETEGDPRELLKAILTKSMSVKEFDLFVK